MATWRSVSRGEPLPEHALSVGTYGMDGQVYVGRLNGEVGKINLKDGKMWNFRAHHQSHSYSAEIFCCPLAHKWVHLNKGDAIPPHAVPGGETPTDGLVFVGHSNQEPGKINVADGKMNHFWSHGQGKCLSAMILVVEPAPITATVTAVVAEPERRGPQAPGFPSSLPELNRMSQEELAQLKANAVLQKDLLSELPGVQDYLGQIRVLSQENKAKAEAILQKEDGVKRAIEQYEHDLSSLNSLRSRVDNLASEKGRIQAQKSPEALVAQLQTGAATDDHQAESVLNDTLEKASCLDASSLSDFSRQFLQAKKQKHSKLALKEMILAAQQ